MSIRKSLSLLLVMVIALTGALVLGVQPSQAAITGVTIVSATCSRATVQVSYSGLVTGTDFIRLYAYITSLGLPAGDLGQVFSPEFTTTPGTVTLTLNFTSSPPPGTNITLWVAQFGNPGAVPAPEGPGDRPTYNCVIPATPTPTPYFFTPGDGRVDPRPGDRIAVYCRSDRLEVWGVRPDSVGEPVASFGYTELIYAGTRGITRGRANLGVIFARGDQAGNFFAAWSGGIYGATGTGDFAKSFHCNVPLIVYPPIIYPYPTIPPIIYPPIYPPNTGFLRVYIVRRGDTFARIARRFGLTVVQLLYYNPQIRNINRIYVGQRIYVP